MASVAPLTFAQAGRSERRRVSRRKRRGPSVVKTVCKPLYAIRCCVCFAIGPISTARDSVPEQDDSGYRYVTIGNIGGWWCLGCRQARERMQPPATRAACIDGPRPCVAALCKYHLGFDRSYKAPHDFEVTESCALDVADLGGQSLRAVGRILGMSPEGCRGIEISGKRKLLMISGFEESFTDFDGEA